METSAKDSLARVFRFIYAVKDGKIPEGLDNYAKLCRDFQPFCAHYAKHNQTEEVIEMSGETNTLEYFHRRGDEVGGERRTLYNRAANALARSRLNTLSEVYSLPEEKLRRVRNLGEKSLAVVLYERERYLSVQAELRE
jgi:DNA-directed RNA polymerase alpha subunit